MRRPYLADKTKKWLSKGDAKKTVLSKLALRERALG